MNQTTKTCSSCPFSRKCERGALGGSPIETYLGQIIGPFFLPCHSAKDYKGNDEKFETCNCQCAGAAIFRANINLPANQYAGLLHLPAGSDPDVFDTLPEFILHHCPGISHYEVAMHLYCMPHYMVIEREIAVAKHGITLIPNSNE